MLALEKTLILCGSKSYIWVHRTSELCECNPIIVFVYELTRGTDHLREFYGDDAERYITCDAYYAYQTFEKEHESVKVCCCFAHMRRRYADALSLIDKKDMSEKGTWHFILLKYMCFLLKEKRIYDIKYNEYEKEI